MQWCQNIHNKFFIVSRNVIAFPHWRWHDCGAKSFMSIRIMYVLTRWRYQIAIGSWDRPSVVSSDRVIKCDYWPLPISGRSIGASLLFFIMILNVTFLDYAYFTNLHCKIIIMVTILANSVWVSHVEFNMASTLTKVFMITWLQKSKKASIWMCSKALTNPAHVA